MPIRGSYWMYRNPDERLMHWKDEASCLMRELVKYSTEQYIKSIVNQKEGTCDQCSEQ